MAGVARDPNERPIGLCVSVDPVTEGIELVRSCVVGDVTQCTGLEFVVQRHSDLSPIVLVRRMLVVQLRVVTDCPTPHLLHKVRWFRVTGRVVIRVDTQFLEFLLGRFASDFPLWRATASSSISSASSRVSP
jgi:hypothetical protein